MSSQNVPIVIPDGASVTSVDISITRSNDSHPISIAVGALPAGVSASITQPGTGDAGMISLTAANTATPGDTPVNLTVSDGQSTQMLSLTTRIAVLDVVSDTADGESATFVSTVLQPAYYGTEGNDYTFFTDIPGATSVLSALNPQHLRTFPVGLAIPQQDANNWDFSHLDQMLAPSAGAGIQNAGDGSPMLVLEPPAFLLNANGSYPADANNPSALDPGFLAKFSAYCANMVMYYNTATGFMAGNGTTYTKGENIQPVAWWTITNEPNVTDIETMDGASTSFTGTQYESLYAAAVTAMQQVASQVPIHFVGPEVADVPGGFGPTFISDFAAAMPTAGAPPINALSVHHYGDCSPFGISGDSDADVLGIITSQSVPDLKSELATAASLDGNPPIWIDENQVNADYGTPGGPDGCGSKSAYVVDPRNEDAFFAAYRPYFYSQMTRAGAQGIFHFKYEGDPYGEVAYEDPPSPLKSGETLFPYWVDYYLARAFPFCTSSTPFCSDANSPTPILQDTSNDTSNIEVLAVSATKSLTVMVVNHSIANSASDFDGPGVPKSVVVDVGAFSGVGYTSGTAVVIDKTLDTLSGPTVMTLDPTQKRLTLTFAGYGVAFITLSR